MTLYGATDPQVAGQQVSPFFGAQNGIRYTGAPTIPLPAQVNAPQVTVLESMARGALPRNTDISTVNGVSVGPQNPTSIDDLMSNGAGNQVNAGVAVLNTNGNPNNSGATNNEIFVDGITTTAATLAKGVAPTNTETLTSCPVSGATVVSNLGLLGTFQG